jgi:hypothetical protein
VFIVRTEADFSRDIVAVNDSQDVTAVCLDVVITQFVMLNRYGVARLLGYATVDILTGFSTGAQLF